MIAFWVVAACLLAGALLFLLPPMLKGAGRGASVDRKAMTLSVYRDQMAELASDLAQGTITAGQHEQGHQELERRLLEDMKLAETGTGASAAPGGRWPAVAIGVAVPLVAVLVYLRLGSPEAINLEQATAQAPAGHQSGDITPAQLAAMVEGLAKRLEKNPNDVEGWVMLGRSYAALGRYTDAATAFGKATEIFPNDAQLWADYADIAAMAAGRKLAGRPTEIIQKALAVDPNNPKALALAGSAAFEVRDFPKAVIYWEQLLKVLPPNSGASQSIAAGIDEARQLGGIKAPAAAAAKPAAATAGGSITGTVALSGKLAEKVAPGDTLYIFARAESGPKMPLAIVRLTAKDLPATFSLDDSMSMMPSMKLSNFPQVVVGARISKSGSPTPQSGDLQGIVQPVKVGATGLKVVIDQVVP